ncbi:GNAT family N-acetyltransferase [Arthrobacter sp. zg-Y1219]|uniref:GNAT family N-acetyltransferase n=1 Tax=Arthrobacter sp. zg-Y1219 TaxID=3049067 RepID=UPI0024C2DE7A|nr:GNAT family N-acetyltransferase [Arthrobacter sp. zg-Y1219]MDK1360512.1 GNAT family N-acetyltransferase [Arthrobacter sp. zg-Y1219]
MTGHSRDDVDLSRNSEQSRYELRIGGELVGTADYVEESDSVALTHTVVRVQWRHQGYSSMLVKFAVEDVIASGRRIKPYCSYAASYLGKHREFSHHVSWPQAAR